nr:MAG TPA: hypothetical protein [Caudoviricetes sp.]
MNFLFGRADLFFEDEVHPVIRFCVPLVTCSCLGSSHTVHLAFYLYYIAHSIITQVYNLYLCNYNSLCRMYIEYTCAIRYNMSCEQEGRKGGRP